MKRAFNSNYPVKECRVSLRRLLSERSLDSQSTSNLDDDVECISVGSSSSTNELPPQKRPCQQPPAVPVCTPEKIDASCVSQQELYHLNDVVGNRHFRALKMIGEGYFGKVVLSQKIGGRDNGKLYALKYQSIACSLDMPSNCVNERKVFEELRGHNYMCQLHYAFKTQASLVYVLDFAVGSELFTYNSLVSNQNGIPTELLRMWAAEIVCALETLHGMQIIYRDLKMENVLIDGDGHIMLTDFGLARKLKPPHYYAFGYGGTLPYMAPEIMSYYRSPNPNRGYTFSVDLWSYGVLLFEMGAGIPPFDINSETDTPAQAEIKALNGSATLKIEQTGHMVHSRDLGDLITRLLNWNPTARLLLDEVRKHSFFRDIDWNRIRRKQHPSSWKPDVRAGDSQDATKHFDVIFTDKPIPVCTSEPPMEVVSGQGELFRGFNYVSPINRRAKLVQPPVYRTNALHMQPSTSNARTRVSASSGFRESEDSSVLIVDEDAVCSTTDDIQSVWDSFKPTQMPKTYTAISTIRAINGDLNFEAQLKKVCIKWTAKYLLFPPKTSAVASFNILDKLMSTLRVNPLATEKKKQMIAHVRAVEQEAAEKRASEQSQTSRRSARLAVKPPRKYDIRF